MPDISCLELFSGAGGLATGLGQAGVAHNGFVEWNKDACITLRHNFGDELVHCVDVRDFDFSKFGHVDIIAGGPPCQPFSLGGKHKGNLDTRDMFPYAAKAISTCTPKVFIFENVKGLLRKSFQNYFAYTILRLTYPELTMKPSEEWEQHFQRLEKVHTSGKYPGTKYKVVYRLIDAADYGVPQRRERVIIVGIREDVGIEWSFPKKTHSIESLLWTQFVDHSYWDRHGIKCPSTSILDGRTRGLAEKLRKQSSLFPPELAPWKTVRDQLADIPEPDSKGSFHDEHVLRDGAKTYPGHTGSYLDMPSKALKAGDHGVPGGENMIRFPDGRVRYFTTYEAKRIQTFPGDYRILGSWTESMRQIGNAVPVELAHHISKSVLNTVWSDMRSEVH